MLAALAAEQSCPLLKTDMLQAFLYGDMGEDENIVKVYIRPPDKWPEPIPEGHVLLLLKSMYGTKQAVRLWHVRTSEWMEQHGYPAMNGAKTVFMKHDGADFITGTDGLFGRYNAWAHGAPTPKRLIHCLICPIFSPNQFFLYFRQNARLQPFGPVPSGLRVTNVPTEHLKYYNLNSAHGPYPHLRSGARPVLRPLIQ
jgi:hypothetical protein